MHVRCLAREQAFPALRTRHAPGAAAVGDGPDAAVDDLVAELDDHTAQNIGLYPSFHLDCLARRRSKLRGDQALLVLADGYGRRDPRSQDAL